MEGTSVNAWWERTRLELCTCVRITRAGFQKQVETGPEAAFTQTPLLEPQNKSRIYRHHSINGATHIAENEASQDSIFGLSDGALLSQTAPPIQIPVAEISNEQL